jgi:hypothetical protein
MTRDTKSTATRVLTHAGVHIELNEHDGLWRLVSHRGETLADGLPSRQHAWSAARLLRLISRARRAQAEALKPEAVTS